MGARHSKAGETEAVVGTPDRSHRSSTLRLLTYNVWFDSRRFDDRVAHILGLLSGTMARALGSSRLLQQQTILCRQLLEAAGASSRVSC